MIEGMKTFQYVRANEMRAMVRLVLEFGERERVLVHAMHEELGVLYDREAKLARMMGRLPA